MHHLMGQLQAHLGLDNYKKHYGWTKMETILTRGDRAAQLAEQIATALLDSNRSALYRIFNDGSLDANGPAEDLIGKMRKNWEAVFPPNPVARAAQSGMTGIMAGVPNAPSQANPPPPPAPGPAAPSAPPIGSQTNSNHIPIPGTVSGNQPKPGTRIINKNLPPPPLPSRRRRR